MSPCPALQSGDLFLSSLLLHIECQGRGIGAYGYAELSSPTSPLLAAATGLLVIFVALFGMRLALGGNLTVRDGVMALVKIGVVLTLAGSWPAYRTVVHDLVTGGPDQIVSRVVGTPAGANARLIASLQTVDGKVVQLTNLGTGRQEYATLPTGADGRPQRFPIADDPALGWARVIFLSSVVAGFAVVQLGGGVLLALAPLFAGLLLFDATRGLFVGWARGLAFVFLGAIATAVILGLQAQLVGPWLDQAISTRTAGGVAATAPVELLALTLAFALGLVGALGMIAFVAFTLHPPSALQMMRHAADRVGGQWAAGPGAAAPTSPRVTDAPARSLVISDAVAAAQRREATAPRRSPGPVAVAIALQAQASAPADDLVIPSFGSGTRRSRPRTSLGARIRDQRR